MNVDSWTAKSWSGSTGKRNRYFQNGTGQERPYQDCSNSIWTVGHFEVDFLNVYAHYFVTSPLSAMENPVPLTALDVPASWMTNAVQYSFTAFLALTSGMRFSFSPVLIQ